MHTIKNDDTKELVDRAYIFNASPKTYSWDVSEDKRLWSASTHNEALRFFRIIMRSIGAKIAPKDQRSEEFNLILRDPIRHHFHFILTRAILHVADMTMSENGVLTDTEPLQILKLADESGCSTS